MFAKTLYKYGFILGRLPEFSQAEISKVLADELIKFTPLLSTKEIFVIEAADKIDLEKLQARLGGIIKISNIQLQISNEPLLTNIEKIIFERIKSLQITKDKKFQFGFSLFGGIDKRAMEQIGLQVKKKLQRENIKSRLIVSKENSLSSVIVKKEKLITQGADIVIIRAGSQFYLGHTESVQDFKEFSSRDYGRPARDDHSGMLPPKLARMMINLSQTDFNQTILDPFCGSGTVIQEALFLGYKNVIGSDISEKAVEFTQNNIDWLKSKYNLDTSAVEIYQLDARDLADLLKKQSIDAIITEPYLGPPVKLQQNRVNKIIDELSDLYVKSFRAFYQVLREGGKVVMVFPVINNQHMNIIDRIKALGFAVDPLSKELRGSITYSRPGQMVLREIFVFKKIRNYKISKNESKKEKI